MFDIKKEKFGKFTKVILINKDTKEFVSMVPGFGASINEIVLMKDNKLYSVLDGYKTADELVESLKSKSIKLIPFPNRLNKGRYTFQRKEYQMKQNPSKNNHATHGFVRDKGFVIDEIIRSEREASVIVKYTYDTKDEPGYPFPFVLKIKCTLNKKGFKVTTNIKNIGDSDLPIGDGWHPYFKLGSKVDDLFIKLPSKKKIEIDETMLPTGGYKIIEEFMSLTKIGDREFDHGFILANKKDVVTTILNSPKDNLNLNFWQETGKWKYNFLQIYTHPSRESIAIEPMTCQTNAFNNKKGLIKLKPNGAFSTSCGVFLD